MKLFNLITTTLLISGLLVQSCSKDALLQQDLVNENQTFDGSSNKFSSKYASFSDEADLNDFLDKFRSMSQDDKMRLISNLPYATITDYLDEIYEGMNNLETREAFVNYLAPYSHLMELAPMENGEEEVVLKNPCNTVINGFLNADGIIAVGGIFQKYIGDYYVSSDNYEQLKTIKSVDDILASALPYVKYAKTSFRHTENLKTQNDRYVVKTWSYEKDVRFCLNDREVELKFYFVTLPTGGDEAWVKLTNRKKGIPCIWYKYKTDVSWWDIHFEYSVNGNPNRVFQYQYGTLNLFDVSEYIYYLEDPTATVISGGDVVLWKKIKSKVSTQGIGTSTLSIDENY